MSAETKKLLTEARKLAAEAIFIVESLKARKAR